MRLRAGLCGLLLSFLVGCGMIPQILRIEVDDRVIEVKPKPLPPAAQEEPQTAEPAPEPGGVEPAPDMPDEQPGQ